MDVSLMPTDKLALPTRAANCLRNMGIHTVGQLATMSDAELLRNPNFGRKSLKHLKEALDEYGVELESTEILDIEQQMKRAMARTRAAKVAYAEAALEVQRLAKRLVDTNLEEIISDQV
jgi:CRISPR/Cas system CMR-associated protein Cmr5 small subunit